MGLREEIAPAERRGQFWAAIVGHTGGARELHTWGDTVVPLPGLEVVRGDLLSPDPFPRDEAVAAELDVEHECPRCAQSRTEHMPAA